MKVKIGGNDYELWMTIGDLEEVAKKYDLSPDAMKKMSMQEYRRFVCWVTHKFLVRRKWSIFKPFITAGNIKRHLSLPEYIELCEKLAKIFNGEDDESKNGSASKS